MSFRVGLMPAGTVPPGRGCAALPNARTDAASFSVICAICVICGCPYLCHLRTPTQARTLQLPCVSRSALPLILLVSLTFFIGLGRGAITDSDEAYYAEAAREMVETGDWLTPHYNYQPRFQKPVLYYWLTAATYLVTGPGEAAARFWSACAGLGLVLVTAACARRWFDDQTALLAGAIAATNFGYVSLARMALPDLPLAFFITLAVFAWFMATLGPQPRPRRWVLLAAVSLALGFLTKGPVALVIPALVVGPLLLIERRALSLRARDVWAGTLVFVIIAVPWYAAMWWTHGTFYLESFFVGDNFERFATSRFNDPRPWWFYVPVVAGGLLPWTPLAIVWWDPIWQFIRRRREVSTIERRLLMWAILPLLFFTASIGKQPRYVLPVLPPLAILLASSIVERTRTWRGSDGPRTRGRTSRALVAGGASCGLFLMVLALLLYRARPVLVNVEAAVTASAAVVIALAGASVLLISLSRGGCAIPLAVALAAGVSFPALHFGTTASSGADTVRQIAALIDDARGSGTALTAYNVFVRNLVFYTRVEQAEPYNDAQLRDFLGRPDRVLAVLPATVADRLERAHALPLKRLAERPCFSANELRVGTMLSPDPARDIERVVLVSNR
jgi:4-amino-4-deoxy-L-arabinose transferase-like glycosyltransferase